MNNPVFMNGVHKEGPLPNTGGPLPNTCSPIPKPANIYCTVISFSANFLL